MITLFDTITPGVLTQGKDFAYAGYVGGHWPDYAEIVRRFPNHYVVSIAVQPGQIARFCDFEQGDFNRVEQVITHIRDMHAKGIWRPGVYASQSDMQNLIGPRLARIFPRAMYSKWGAVWNNVRDIPFDWDAHQLADHGPQGQNEDITVCRDDFFPRHATHPHHAPLRTWTKPVTAKVTFDTQTGDWKVAGG